MDTQSNPIARLLDEMEALYPNHPELVLTQAFFEIWENNLKPRPFPVKGPTLTLGSRRLVLPSKGTYIVHAAWNPDLGCPEVVAENPKTRYPFHIRMTEGEVTFHPGTPVPVDPRPQIDGEAMEVVYDVINHILADTPDMDIFTLKRSRFVKALAELDVSYDDALLRRMARLSKTAIEDLIRQAAEDMALDDISSQLSLPLANSYAIGSDARSDAMETRDADAPGHAILPLRTHWTITQELELLLSLARFNHEVQSAFTLPLSGCEILPMDHPNRTVIRIRGVGDSPLFEGARMAICRKDHPGSLGSAVIGLVDGETLFAEIFLKSHDDKGSLRDLCLRPQKAPQERVLMETRALFDRACGRPETIEGALRPILGLEPAGESIQTGSPKDKRMDFSQQRAYEEAIHPANPVVVVQGPPGTGKTWVLTEVIRALCRQGLRILVTAPSNTAVDNVVKAITDLPVLRFGNASKVDPMVQNTCWTGISDNVDAWIKKFRSGKAGSVFAATGMRALFDDVINRDLQQRGLYDVVIFDEAGMTRMDEFLLCARMGRRVILFGDHRQLPPFPLSASVTERLGEAHPHLAAETRQIIRLSALEWLTAVRRAPLILLQRAYRCQNPRLLRFSSTLFYSARVKTSEKAEYLRLPYYERQRVYPPSTLRIYCTSPLPEALKQETIVLDDTRMGIENRCEAEICRYLLLEALQRYPAEEITLISPYKRQTSAIRSLLDYETVRSALPPTMDKNTWSTFLSSRIATVDSFQGGESDLVIISYVRSNTGQGIGFTDNPNRINVAHTRCRRELIVVGDLECLKRQAGSDIFLRMERAFNREGEIVDLDEELFKEMGGSVYR